MRKRLREMEENPPRMGRRMSDQFFERSAGEGDGAEKCQTVCRGLGHLDAHQAEAVREEIDQGNKENSLPGHGQESGGAGFADGLE